jgi:hypothetical protein
VRRIIGFVMLVVALIGILISIAGTYIGFQFVDSIGAALDQTLTIASDALGTTSETLSLTKRTVEQAEEGLGTVVTTAENLATTIDETRPLLDQVTTVATGSVPDSLAAVEDTIPNLVEVAGAIDNTLQALEAFQFSRSVLGVDFAFDLGIEYQPEQRFDESVALIGVGLEGVPESLRDLQSDLDVANKNLATISENILTISGDLAAINSSVADLPALVQDYVNLIDETNAMLLRAKTSVNQQLQNVKIGVIVLFVWFGLNQIVPLFLGLDLLADGTLGSRKEEESERDDDSDENTEVNEDKE